MRGLFSTVVLALLIGCVGCGADMTTDPPGGDDGHPTVPPPPPPPPSCPLGEASFTRALGLAGADTALDIAIDARGNAVVAAANGEAKGVTVLSSSGEIVATFPFGTLVATDRAGNTYVAGSFTQPINLGLGVMLPQGNIDVFVARIDASGNVVFAHALGLCGDGVASLAVGADGRIAVSGSAMGTVVLSASGDVEFSLAFAGDVAFDSHGNLVVAGSFTSIDLGDGVITAAAGGTDGFVIVLDRSGKRVSSRVMTGATRVTSVAVDANDSIVLVGWTTASVDLFGVTIRAHYGSESGRISGAFVAKLDAAGNRVFAIDGPLGSEANSVAVDGFGNIYVNGAGTGNTSFGRIVQLDVLTPAGALRQEFFEFVASGDGRGFGVATDACATVYATFDASDQVFAGSPIRAYVVKLSP